MLSSLATKHSQPLFTARIEYCLVKYLMLGVLRTCIIVYYTEFEGPPKLYVFGETRSYIYTVDYKVPHKPVASALRAVSYKIIAVC